MANLKAQPSIASDARTSALMRLIGRLDALDLTPLLVYRIDSVPASALPFLAWQFDVLPLLQIFAPAISQSIDALTDIDVLTDLDLLLPADTSSSDSLLRTFIKNAIALHRFRGTPWAIKSALAMLGWTRITLLEGQESWGGHEWPSDQGWAVFRIVYELEELGAGGRVLAIITPTGTDLVGPTDLADITDIPTVLDASGQPIDFSDVLANQSVPAGAIDRMLTVVDFFKPERSWLDIVDFISAPAADLVTLRDGQLVTGTADTIYLRDFVLGLATPDLSDTLREMPTHSGQWKHGGGQFTYRAVDVGLIDGPLTCNGVIVQ